VALRYRTLFRRLGTGLDGPGTLDDADAWYCILEGTAEVTVAEAQARALIDLLASYITSAQASREVLLAVDEFSAVSRRLPIWSLYERARSLGLAVQVSAQSWHGLAPDDTDRYRIVSAAEGGIWLLRTPHPEPVTDLVGQRKALDTSRHLLRFPRWRRTGTTRVRDLPVADPALVRTLDVGQAAYLYRGGVTFVQVSRLVATPPALAPSPPGGPAVTAANLPDPLGPPSTVLPLVNGVSAPTNGRLPPGSRPSRYPGSPTSPAVLADIAELLDAAFGPEPGRPRSANSTKGNAAAGKTAEGETAEGETAEG
jgi:hypothetical protein